MTESQLKTKIMAWLKTVPNCKAIRVEQRPGMGRGVSDILVCFRGLFAAIEVKMPGKKTTSLQDKFLVEVQKAGGSSIVLYGHSYGHAVLALNDFFIDLEKRIEINGKIINEVLS